MSEELIIRHCSPTLAGMKTGNMFACPFSSEEDIKNSIRILNKKLIRKGLRILPLRYSNGRALIYVYRPKKLKQDLINTSASCILHKIGYPYNNPDHCVAQLIKKLRSSSDFPHEIGLFLGYPPEDVQGFIENKAEKYKCTGCWKVYGDENKARRIFSEYKKCAYNYYRLWQKGKTIEWLTAAV